MLTSAFGACYGVVQASTLCRTTYYAISDSFVDTIVDR